MPLDLKNLTEAGDLISGTALQHFMKELGKDEFLRSSMVTNVNPTGTSYQNLSFQGEKDSLQFKAAIPADVWYFWPMPPELDFLSGLELFEVTLKGPGESIGVLKQPKNETDSVQVIPLMRYQTVGKGISFDWDIGAVPKDCCGFLDFIVGPLGVMKTLSLCGEDTGWAGDILEGGKVIPPHTETPPSPSINLITDAYQPLDGVQILANHLAGEIKPKVHSILRMKLMKDAVLPVPGEFLALLARPAVDFAWFSQDTSPFMVGGNYFHTAAYTSGIITAVEGSNKYTVNVEGEDVTGISSSDYLEYSEGERVALMHTLPSNSKFAWKDTMPTSSLRIVPITFYQT